MDTDHGIREKLSEIKTVLDALLFGEDGGAIAADTGICELDGVIESLNRLSKDAGAVRAFALELSRGNTQAASPERHNYIAAPFKQLHSSLSALEWGMRQLAEGRVVSKLEDTGGLYSAFNSLVDNIAGASIYSEYDLDAHDGSVNSWRYHQILAALNLLHIIVIEADSEGRVVYANRQARNYLKGSESLLPPDDSARQDALKAQLYKIGASESAFPSFCELYDGVNGTWYKIASDKFLLPNGQVFYLHMADNISEWKAHESHLVFCATTDAMTGTLNRQSGMEELANMIRPGMPPKTHCMAFFDMDRLKEINDMYGHREGDKAIKAVAGILLSSVRGSDVVSRNGGDEFMVLFRDCTEQMAVGIVDRMYEKAKLHNERSGKPYKVSFSGGVISFSSDTAMSADDLLAQADARMYENKLGKEGGLKAGRGISSPGAGFG